MDVDTVPTKRIRSDSDENGEYSHRASSAYEKIVVTEDIVNGVGPTKPLVDVILEGSSIGDDPMLHIENPSSEWRKVVQKVTKSVVSIISTQPVSFDTDRAGCFSATGFIVDAKRGYVMTNRHVVQNGPFVGYLIFENHEEVEAFSVYRDPVHDFGILRFDPGKVKYMEVKALPLRPKLAQVGLEIRVVGNDSGEKLSIHAGYISRLDRNAPELDSEQTDFNTNYLQAAVSLSGGSSGSPVVAIDGSVVALQAAGNESSSTDFFLPLDRPKRALECLQNDAPITRGTIQCQWDITPYGECRRLGLTSAQESMMRSLFVGGTTMLAAVAVVPEGPSSGNIEEGDLLLAVQDKPMTSLIELESILDENVGNSVKIDISRGGQEISFLLNVGSTHAIHPDRYVEAAGARFNLLSYHLACKMSLPVKGVYLCDSPENWVALGLEQHSIIESIDRKPIPDLDTLINVMSGLPDRARVVISWRHVENMHTLMTKVFQLEKKLNSTFRMAVRNDITGIWDFKDLPQPPPPKEPSALNIQYSEQIYEKDFPFTRYFARVSFYGPCKIDGVTRSTREGYALIVDAERGLAVVSRTIVPYDIGQLTLTFAEALAIPGVVKYLHPTLSFAVIAYDPALVGPEYSKTPKIMKGRIRQAENVSICGWSLSRQPMKSQTHVLEIKPISIPHSSVPRYKAVNLEAVRLHASVVDDFTSAVIMSQSGEVAAFWMSVLSSKSYVIYRINGYLLIHRLKNEDRLFYLALPMEHIMPSIEYLQQGKMPNFTILPAELRTVFPVTARDLGLDQGWISKIEESSKTRTLFQVSEAYKVDHRVLREGDLLLSVDGKVITEFSDLNCQFIRNEVDMEILREGKVDTLKVHMYRPEETSHFLYWAGALLQPPPLSVFQQSKNFPSMVYTSGSSPGSPVSQYGLHPTSWITHVNGEPTPDLPTFIDKVKHFRDDGSYVRLRTVSFDQVPLVITIKPNHHYFPTVEGKKVCV